LRLVAASAETTFWGGKATLKDVAERVGIAAQFDEKNQFRESVYAEFGQPGREPFTPPELKGWIDSTPEIRAMQ
jgi:hypothetical protein